MGLSSRTQLLPIIRFLVKNPFFCPLPCDVLFKVNDENSLSYTISITVHISKMSVFVNMYNTNFVQLEKKNSLRSNFLGEFPSLTGKLIGFKELAWRPICFVLTILFKVNIEMFFLSIFFIPEFHFNCPMSESFLSNPGKKFIFPEIYKFD